MLQVKDQIGSFFYFPSLALHKAAGGFGGLRIASRPTVPVPFPLPAGEFTILAGDWFKLDHTVSHLSNKYHIIFKLYVYVKNKDNASYILEYIILLRSYSHSLIETYCVFLEFKRNFRWWK